MTAKLNHLVLASSSPRRSELLALTGLQFDIVKPEVDETRQPGEAPPDYVLRLSKLKARTAAQALKVPALLLAADTIVALGDDLLGKPHDPEEARAMLARLRGRDHTVYSAITLLDSASGREVSDLAATTVPMRDYSDAEVAAYIASGDPFDKAGAYAIQHREFQPVGDLQDCFANVMGLPLCHLTRSLHIFDINPANLTQQTATACQSHLDYLCPVYDEILAGAALDAPPPPSYNRGDS